MIKCKIDREKNIVRVKCKGPAASMTAEILALIQQVHHGIKVQNEFAAEGFRLDIIGSLLDPKSPVWKE